MLQEIYDNYWELIDPALYAAFASLTFSIWLTIF